MHITVLVNVIQVHLHLLFFHVYYWACAVHIFGAVFLTAS